MRSGDEMPVRWTAHALEALVDRNVNRLEAEQAIAEPEFVAPGIAPWLILMRRYDDAARQRRS